MKAILIFRQKINLLHNNQREIAVAEIKIWNVPKTSDYPDGIKYSLFLISLKNGQIVFGLDNHKPKGPHLHIGQNELRYHFRGIDALVEDF